MPTSWRQQIHTSVDDNDDDDDGGTLGASSSSDSASVGQQLQQHFRGAVTDDRVWRRACTRLPNSITRIHITSIARMQARVLTAALDALRGALKTTGGSVELRFSQCTFDMPCVELLMSYSHEQQLKVGGFGLRLLGCCGTLTQRQFVMQECVVTGPRALLSELRGANVSVSCE